MNEFNLRLQNFDETMQLLHRKYPALTPDQLTRAALIVCVAREYSGGHYKVQFRVGRSDIVVAGKVEAPEKIATGEPRKQ